MRCNMSKIKTKKRRLISLMLVLAMTVMAIPVLAVGEINRDSIVAERDVLVGEAIHLETTFEVIDQGHMELIINAANKSLSEIDEILAILDSAPREEILKQEFLSMQKEDIILIEWNELISGYEIDIFLSHEDRVNESAILVEEFWTRKNENFSSNEILSIEETEAIMSEFLAIAPLSGFLDDLNSYSLAEFLNQSDGLTIANQGRLFIHADTARRDAIANFVDTPTSMMRDAYRHFAWNFHGTRDSSVGENRTRIATTNHEWVSILINDVTAERLRLFNQRFFELARNPWMCSICCVPAIARTYSRTGAYQFALRERADRATRATNSLVEFNAIFGAGHVMDFWNNRSGRYYGRTLNTGSSINSFNIALTRSVLVNSTGSIIRSESGTHVNAQIRSILRAHNAWWFPG